MEQHLTPPPALPDRYRLWPDAERALLGRGGAGEVWRAQDQALGVLVAMKVLRTEGAKMRARLGREAALAAQVAHPNVVALHDMGETRDGSPFLAFALASDGSLLDQATSPPPWPELLPLLIDLLEALGALHARSLLHLDVKLSNLLLHRTGPRRRVLWLADLGIARALYSDPDEEQTVLGTVSYMASERLTGQRHLWGPSTDLFSVGAIAWRLVTGQLPFPAKDPVAALSSRRRVPGTLAVRPGYAVPPGLEAVLTPLLAYDRRARFDLAADVIHALLALPPLQSDGPPTRRSPNPAGAPANVPPGTPPWHRPTPPPLPAQRPRRPAARRIPQSPSLLQHREIPLIGRDAEMDAIWADACATAAERTPRIVHLSGPRGIGRTRMVLELIRDLEQRGYAEGAMLEYAVRESTASGLRGAWRRIAPPEPEARGHIEHLATLLARDRVVPVDSMREEAAALSRWISPRDGGPSADVGLVSARLVDHLALRAWRGLSWLWLEDLHLADEADPVWDLLARVLSRNAGILVLATSRDEMTVDRLGPLAARFRRPLRRLDLGPLSEFDAEALVQAHLPLEPALAAALARHTTGNPRYLHDLLLHWVRSGVLVEKRGNETRWGLAASAPPLPADRHAFAQERLAHALQQDPALLPPLLAVALAGRGTPERVVAYAAGEGFNRLFVAGLATLERGSLVLQPPELPAAVRMVPRDPSLDADVHAKLAAAWAQEVPDPISLARIGHHRAEAGQLTEALQPLDQALTALRRTLPAAEVIRLARRTQDVALRAPPPGGPGSVWWARATMALADATWLRGDLAGARALDEAVVAVPLPAEDAIRAACQYAAHLLREDTPLGMARLAQVAPLLPQVNPRVQAEYYSTRGRCRNRLLDDEGALEDLGTALTLQPDPETEALCHHFRAMLLSLRGRDESFREAVRAQEIARQHGLLRWEALAWTSIGEQLVLRGRTDEAITQLRAAFERLRDHGELLFAGTLLNNLGEVLRQAGRDAEARATYRSVLDNPAFRVGDVPAIARANLALMAIADRDGADALSWAPVAGEATDDPAVTSAWALIEPLARLLQGERPELPDLDAVARAVRLGPDGVFLDLALVMILEEQGRREEARQVELATARACDRFQVDPDAAEPWLDHFRARRPRQP